MALRYTEAEAVGKVEMFRMEGAPVPVSVEEVDTGLEAAVRAGKKILSGEVKALSVAESEQDRKATRKRVNALLLKAKQELGRATA